MSSPITTYGTMYYVKDMKKAASFYKDNLGFKARFESPEWTEFQAGETALCLHVQPDELKIENGVVIFSVNDIRNLVSAMKKRGVEFLGDVKEVHPGAYSVNFRDPDGNFVNLYEDTTKK